MKNNSHKTDLEKVFDMLKDDIVNAIASQLVLDTEQVSNHKYGKAEGATVFASARFQLRNGYPDFDFSIWDETIPQLIDKCKFAEFSCWSKETEVINEILDNILLVDKWNVSEQIIIRGQLNENTRRLLIEDYLQQDKRVKWFGICLFDKDENVIFGIDHYCNQLHIDGLDKDNLDRVMKLFNESLFDIHIY
jgi:hypothetical protein